MNLREVLFDLRGERSTERVGVLTEYDRIPIMKIIVDGRRIIRGCDGVYFEKTSCLTKNGLNKRNVLHELYHHIVENMGLKIPEKKEEQEAERFIRWIITKEKCKSRCAYNEKVTSKHRIIP
jgi:hypothetical protein